VHGDEPGGPIRWRMHLAVAPERVYAALDDADGRASFWAESAPEQGGAIVFSFVDGSRHRAQIMERVPPRVWAIDYFGGVARFELAPDGRGGTDLLLTHHDVAPEEWSEVHAGWLNVLFPLKAWLVHGVDLRNHDPSRTWLQGYADQ
jgi:uncharacterized protein YndB with AHSA1/START domain